MPALKHCSTVWKTASWTSPALAARLPNGVRLEWSARPLAAEMLPRSLFPLADFPELAWQFQVTRGLGTNLPLLQAAAAGAGHFMPQIDVDGSIRRVPLLVSYGGQVIDQLRIYLSARLADTVNLHGVYMDVLGMGVLITGDSGVGKSELALELISRGHGLVADDVVEMARIAPTTIEGRCPGICWR